MPSKPFPSFLAGLILCLACSGPDRTGTANTSGQGGAGGSSTTGGGGSAGSVVTTPTSTTSTGAGGVGTASTTTAQSSSGGTSGMTGDMTSFVPADLPIYKIEGTGDGLNLTTLTLQSTASGAEVFASVSNDGTDTACDTNITLEFFDQAEQSVAAWVGPLYVEQVFQQTDDPSSLVACLEPGKTAMLGTPTLPASVVVSELGYVAYRFSYFERGVLPFELTPIEAFTISSLEAFRTASGSAFRGTLENGLAVPVENPIVTVFPVNRVQRPLGIATSTDGIEIAPGDSWMFETGLVNQPGVDQKAHAIATPLYP